jgi:hypothetical protein
MTYISRKVIFIIKSLFTQGIAVEMVVILKTKLICSDLKAVTDNFLIESFNFKTSLEEFHFVGSKLPRIRNC